MPETTKTQEGGLKRVREILQWFADYRNYEDTEQFVAYLKYNPFWANGIKKAEEALAALDEAQPPPGIWQGLGDK